MHTGSASRAQGTTGNSGSQGIIKTAHPLGAQVRPKKGSCNAVISRGKGNVQIHESLDGPQQTTALAPCSSTKGVESRENVEAEECRESRAYKVYNVLDNREGRHSGTNTHRIRSSAAAASSQEKQV